MSSPHRDQIGLLVVRAIVEDEPKRRLLIRILEVNPAGADRVIGLTASARTATQLIRDWLDSFGLAVDADRTDG